MYLLPINDRGSKISKPNPRWDADADYIWTFPSRGKEPPLPILIDPKDSLVRNLTAKYGHPSKWASMASRNSHGKDIVLKKGGASSADLLKGKGRA